MRTAVGVILIAGLLCVEIGRASESNSAAAFLRQNGGVRPTAMGGAYVAVADNAQAIYFNPAGLGLCRRPEIAATFSPQKFEQDGGSFEAAAPVGSGGALGLGLQYFRVTDILLRQNEFDLSSDASSTEWAASLGYGKSLGRVAIGGTVKYMAQEFSGLSDSGKGYAMDLGADYSWDRFVLGLSLQNVVGGFHWSTGTDDPLLLTEKIGAAWRAAPWLLTALDLETGDGRAPRLHGGVEARYRAILLRGGFNHTHPTVGFGIGLPFSKTRMTLDYGAEFDIDGLNDIHRFGISVGLP